MAVKFYTVDLRMSYNQYHGVGNEINTNIVAAALVSSSVNIFMTRNM